MAIRIRALAIDVKAAPFPEEPAAIRRDVKDAALQPFLSPPFGLDRIGSIRAGPEEPRLLADSLSRRSAARALARRSAAITSSRSLLMVGCLLQGGEERLVAGVVGVADPVQFLRA